MDFIISIILFILFLTLLIIGYSQNYGWFLIISYTLLIVIGMFWLLTGLQYPVGYQQVYTYGDNFSINWDYSFSNPPNNKFNDTVFLFQTDKTIIYNSDIDFDDGFGLNRLLSLIIMFIGIMGVFLTYFEMMGYKRRYNG